jgi:hypothetical protein
MIVQLRITDFWGSDKDIEERDAIAEVIGASLKRLDCGYFDGTDVGGGATNLFFCDVSEARWDEAVAIALKVIERCGALEKVVIAKSVFMAHETEPTIEHSVAWPRDFRGKFDIFRWSGST